MQYLCIVHMCMHYAAIHVTCVRQLAQWHLSSCGYGRTQGVKGNVHVQYNIGNYFCECALMTSPLKSVYRTCVLYMYIPT